MTTLGYAIVLDLSIEKAAIHVAAITQNLKAGEHSMNSCFKNI